jgi:hypothetical protein
MSLVFSKHSQASWAPVALVVFATGVFTRRGTPRAGGKDRQRHKTKWYWAEGLFRKCPEVFYGLATRHGETFDQVRSVFAAQSGGLSA